jgi:hypothetical protein
MSDALKLAFEYTKQRYQSLDQIISFLRGYAMRNKAVHPVKQWFDEGKAQALRSAIFRDYDDIPFLGTGPKVEALRKEAREVLELVTKTFFLQWNWNTTMDG